VCGKAKATVDIVLSSFEGELEGVQWGSENNVAVATKFVIGGLTEAFKQTAATVNVLHELEIYPESRRVFSDNEAMVDFVNGEAQAKAMRHASLRLWYMRQCVNRGFTLDWMSGLDICANPMTKAVFQEEHRRHVYDVLGHALLEDEAKLIVEEEIV